jgi:3',5'-cyclic AMP phosphodiesterase CpdA
MSIVSEQLLQPIEIRPVKISALPAKHSLRILLLPDLHIPASPEHHRLLLDSRAFLEEHDWVVLLGDVTAYYGTVREYDAVRAFIHELDRPYGVVNGNHEFFFGEVVEDSGEYGVRWTAGSAQAQRAQISRFERFYGNESQFDAGSYGHCAFCLLGIDSIGPEDQALLSKEHDSWFADVLAQFEDRPIFIFSHFPLCDPRLETIRYYQEGRKPYLSPSARVRELLRRRAARAFWFSGHVHFKPSHPLAKPYLTTDGVWQFHCPDARGYGRDDDQLWQPQQYDGLFVRSMTLEPNRLLVTTTDLRRGRIVGRDEFQMQRPAQGQVR